MAETVVAVVRKNSKEEIRISFDVFNGHQLFNARVWFEAEDGTMRPGKAGLAFKVDRLAEFHAAVDKSLAEARARGLVR